jgi:hypothetical protein
MANVRITDLDLIPFSSITSDDVFPIVDIDADVTYKIDISGLTKYISSQVNKWYIQSGETITVPSYSQKFIYGDLLIEGILLLEDDSNLFVINGNIELISGGTISGSGVYHIIDLPEVDTYVTGGTYNIYSGTTEFKNNFNDVFSVTGLPISNFTYIPSDVVITVPSYTQKFVYGDIIIDGEIILKEYSELFVLNGDIIITGGTITQEPNSIIYSVSLPEFDTKVSAFTYLNNTFTIYDNSGNTFNAEINTMTGLTVNGILSATTISATTIDLCGSNGTLYTNSISGCSPIDILSETYFYEGLSATTISGGTLFGDGSNLTGVGTVPFSGGVVTGFSNFTNGLSSTSISATTYYNVSTNFQYEVHVSQVDGNDTTGDGSLLNPVATITKALTLLNGSRKTIIVHPGGYNENVTVANGNTTIATSELTGANTLLSGTLTIGTLGSGSRISGLKMTNLVISGTAQAYISNCTVDTQVTKSSSGYVEIINSELQCIFGIQISGSGTTIINGNKNVGVSVSNPSAQVIIKGCNSVVTPSASAGNLAIVDCIVTALGGNAITITNSATTLTLINSQVLVQAGNSVAPISVAGIYSIINTIYNKPGSTLTGTNTNSIDYFQFINADKFITQGGTSSQYVMGDGSLSNGFTGGTVTGDTIYENGLTATTLSATTISGGTFYGDGSNLTGIGGGGNFLPLSGGTVTGNTIFTQSITANTINNLNLGIGSGNINTNISIGSSSLISNTTGNYNVSLGVNSLLSNTTGYGNTSIGWCSLVGNTIGGRNIAIGRRSMIGPNTGSNNIAVGEFSLCSNSSGRNNIAIGYGTLRNNTTSCGNIGFGGNALRDNTTGCYNIAIGSRSSLSNTTGNHNISLGYYSLRTNTTGTNNIALGQRSLSCNTTGIDNVSLGRDSLRLNTTGAFNVGLGYRSLCSNTTGGCNIALGYRSLCSNTTGTRNVALGRESLVSNTTGSFNIALGNGSLQLNTSGCHNVGLGHFSSRSNTTGGCNIGLGYFSLFSNTTGNNNVALGYRSLCSNTTGANNVALGNCTQTGNFSGSTILGSFAVATANQQFVLGSSTIPIGPIATESCTSNKTLQINLNGNLYKLLLFQ